MMLAGESILASNPNGLQKRKLFGLLNDAASNVPMYSQLYSNTDLDDRSLSLPEMLNRLPVLSKTDLLATTLEDRLNRRFARDALIEESTTGSTGQPFSLRIEKSYKYRRNLRFLKGFLAVGFRPWQRLMLLSDRYIEPKRVGTNFFYEPVEQSTSAILEAYQRIKPQVLYGFLTPLRLLADCLTEESRGAHQPRLVISTAEMLDPHAKGYLELVFGCPVADFYGLTEMGLVAWQKPGFERYTMARNSVLTEFVPDSSVHDRYRILVTNLDLHASPIIRFDTGDLAKICWIEDKPRLAAVEGRRLDAIVSQDGEEISPYRITDALRDIAGLRRFKITQRDLTDILIGLEVDDSERNRIEVYTRATLGELLGDGLHIEVEFHSQLVPDASRKFKPVESLVGRH